MRPTAVPGGGGIPTASLEHVVVASFNNLRASKSFKLIPANRRIILDAILMKTSDCCMQQPGFLQGRAILH